MNSIHELMDVIPLMLICVSLMAAVAVLLVAEWRSFRLGIWLAKPLASTLFIASALLAGATFSLYGRLILLGLVLSWLGDVFLIFKHRLSFVAGLASFLLAHIAYTAAFACWPLQVGIMALVATAMSGVAFAVLRWLWPNVPTGLRVPVVCYVIAIGVMVIFAGGTAQAAGAALVLAAIVFAASDVFVAREQFVTPTLANKLWGLPLYYGAQLVLALSVSAAP